MPKRRHHHSALWPFDHLQFIVCAVLLMLACNLYRAEGKHTARQVSLPSTLPDRKPGPKAAARGRWSWSPSWNQGSYPTTLPPLLALAFCMM
jgi:hypothetical protein